MVLDSAASDVLDALAAELFGGPAAAFGAGCGAKGAVCGSCSLLRDFEGHVSLPQVLRLERNLVTPACPVVCERSTHVLQTIKLNILNPLPVPH